MTAKRRSGSNGEGQADVDLPPEEEIDAQQEAARETLGFGEEEWLPVRVTLVGQTPVKPQAMTDDKILDIARKAGTEAAPHGLSREDMKRWLIEHMVKPCLYARDGVFGFPSKCVLEALIGGGHYVKTGISVGQKQFSASGKSLVPSHVIIVEDFLPFPTSCQQWHFDLDHGWGKKGDFVVIARPRFDIWALRMTCCVDVSEFPESKFQELFRQTGKKIGLGGHRPAKKGRFGQFVVARWEKLEAMPDVLPVRNLEEFMDLLEWPEPQVPA